MAQADQTAYPRASCPATAAGGCRERVLERLARARRGRAAGVGTPLLAVSILALALAACGASPSARSSAEPSASSATLSAQRSARLPSSSSSAPARTTARGGDARVSRIDGSVVTAKATYYAETKGPKLLEELGRIARDPILLSALARGDDAGARAEANAQLKSPVNHLAHVTRISVIRGARVIVNATINSDGVFVVAPGIRALRSHGRPVGTLLVSIQDVTGFVKLVHRLTGAEVVVRGGSGRVRASLRAAARVGLPASGNATIAGRGYLVRSFSEIGWGNEALTVWILQRA